MTFRLFILIYGFAAVLLAGSSKKSKDLEGPNLVASGISAVGGER